VTHATKLRHERSGVAILAAVQFINLLDFMIVMPLGPDFAHALGMPTSQVGMLGGAYTLAGAISALLAARFLDRWDRRTALLVALAGLLAGTFACAMAHRFETLLAARIIAGLFGGPATSLALAAVSDLVPEARRGQAMGHVAMGFAIASVVGVPIGLELANWGDWRTPFWVIGALGIGVMIATQRVLPPLRDHLDAPPSASWDRALWSRPEAWWGLLGTASTAIASFLLIPNISAFVQFNLDYPRAHLGLLYLVGGLCSLISLRWVGRWVDRFGALRVASVSTVIFAANVLWGYVQTDGPIVVMLMFVLFMVSASTRNLANTTQISRIPPPHQRARFMALNSAVLHLACAIGAMGSAQLLTASASGALMNMPYVGILAVVAAILLPPLTWQVEHRLRAPK
jgi:predicted MFS family arabinose efflux permease